MCHVSVCAICIKLCHANGSNKTRKMWTKQWFAARQDHGARVEVRVKAAHVCAKKYFNMFACVQLLFLGVKTTNRMERVWKKEAEIWYKKIALKAWGDIQRVSDFTTALAWQHPAENRRRRRRLSRSLKSKTGCCLLECSQAHSLFFQSKKKAENCSRFAHENKLACGARDTHLQKYFIMVRSKVGKTGSLDLRNGRQVFRRGGHIRDGMWIIGFGRAVQSRSISVMGPLIQHFV